MSPCTLAIVSSAVTNQNLPAIDPQLVQQHIRRAVELMEAIDADGLLVFRDTNILGFCGVPLGPTDRLVCGLLNRQGRIAFVMPAFETAIAEGLPPGSQVIAWEEHEDPYAAVGRAASALGIASGSILLDGRMWLDSEARLTGSMNGATLFRDTKLIDYVRMTKSPEEIDAIRDACRDTGRIYEVVGETLRAGMSEIELKQVCFDRLHREGIGWWGELIQGGENGAVPHRRTGDRRFQEGDAVVVDFVAQRGGYLGDMTRMFVIGRPSDDLRRVYRVVREAQQAAIRSVRPGVTCESIDAAARDVICAAGLGEQFTHRTGHGIGLDVHEPPYIVRGNRDLVRPGMCFTIEPGVYVPGRFGVRIEDVVVVTADGCEVLTGGVPTDVCPALAV